MKEKTLPFFLFVVYIFENSHSGLISIFEKFPRKTLLVVPTVASALIGAISIFSLRFSAKGVPLSHLRFL